MAYVTVPKDLTKVKSKVLFGLTRRQLVCFGAAVLIGVPLFFLLRKTVNSSTATVCMIVVMLPLFLLTMYEKNGQPLEVIVGQIIQTVFLRPKERPYMTNNFYAAVERQIQVEKPANKKSSPKEDLGKENFAGSRQVGRAAQKSHHGVLA